MALAFVDGFDHYSGAQILNKWTGIVGSPVTAALLPDYARGTGQGLAFTAMAISRWLYRTVWPAGSATVTMGAAVYLTTNPTTNAIIFMLVNGSAEQVSVRGDGAGKLTVYRGSSNLLATSTNSIGLNAWHYIEFKATVATGTGGTIELRVDGTATGWVPSTGSLNTAAAAVANATGIALASAAGGNLQVYFDDLYALDSSGSVNTTFLGDCKVATLRPQSVGNYAQWTSNGGPNFANVADDPYYDGDTSFNQSATANQIDSFVFDDIPAATGSVFGIQHAIWAKKDVGAARTFAAFQRSGSNDYVGATQNVGTSYAMFLDVKETNPDTGIAWTVAGANGAEWGYKEIS